VLTIAPLGRNHLGDARELLAAACEHDPAAAVAEEKLFGAAPPPHTSIALGAFDGGLVGVAVVSSRWLRLIAVHPEARGHGVGSALLDAAAATGPRQLRTCDQPGNYLAPGIDERNEATLAFFQRRGFTPVARYENLAVRLVDNQLVTPDRAAALAADAAARGYDVRRARPEDREAVLALARSFSGGWAFEAARALDNHPSTVHIAQVHGGPVVAFACIDGNNRGLGWFGPAGTAEEHRGRKLGQSLLIPCLLDAAAAGHREATIAWIGPRAFYEGACDARSGRTFSVLAKDLA
jgi:mycothiol synthase